MKDVCVCVSYAPMHSASFGRFDWKVPQSVSASFSQKDFDAFIPNVSWTHGYCRLAVAHTDILEMLKFWTTDGFLSFHCVKILRAPLLD